MVEATELKLFFRGPLEWHYTPTRFHEDLPIGSEVDKGGQREGETDTHTGWWSHKPIFIFGKYAKIVCANSDSQPAGDESRTQFGNAVYICMKHRLLQSSIISVRI
jgi:hypothetical protein